MLVWLTQPLDFYFIGHCIYSLKNCFIKSKVDFKTASGGEDAECWQAVPTSLAGWNSRFLLLAELLEAGVSTQRVPFRIEP